MTAPTGMAGSPNRRRVLLAAAAVALSGCATVGEERVDVHLANVALLDATLFEQRLLLTLRFQNRGNVALPVDGLAYRIEANGTTLASGVDSAGFTIPRYGEAQVDVAATMITAGIMRQIRDLQRQASAAEPRLRYRLYGTAHLQGSVYTFGRGSTLSFETLNELPLPPEPAVPVPTPAPATTPPR